MATEQSSRAIAQGPAERERPPADRLHIGAGSENPDGAVTIDKEDWGHTDYVRDIREPWPFVDDCFSIVVANHVLEHIADPVPVFREAARVLRDHGAFVVRVPVGVDALADPTHESVWTWRTPTFYSSDAEPWQPGAVAELPFRVAHRDLNVWSHWQSEIVDAAAQWLANRRPIAAQQLPGCSGELTVRFEVVR